MLRSKHEPESHYSISRSFSNLNHNDRGGWVDAGGSGIPNRYAEQLWITLFTNLRDLQSGQLLTGTQRGDHTLFEMPLDPGSYRVFSAE